VLVFLGLLGTFYGLLETVRSVAGVIGALNVGASDVARAFADLKSGLESPLHGMGTAFSSSLFGLAGSLVLGFLDLQAGQAQNRFYNELEEWLSTYTRLSAGPLGEGDGSVPAYIHALLEQTADSLDNLQRILARGEEGRIAANATLASLTDRLGVLGEDQWNVGIEPPAAIVERRGQIPMIERDVRLNSGGEQCIDQSIVKGEPRGVDAAAAFGQHATPRDAEPIGVQAELAHERDVFRITTVVIAGDVAVLAIRRASRTVREAIPDARPRTVGTRRPLDLIRRGRGTPQKPVRKTNGQSNGLVIFVIPSEARNLLFRLSKQQIPRRCAPRDDKRERCAWLA